jgi:hypothetical protein
MIEMTILQSTHLNDGKAFPNTSFRELLRMQLLYQLQKQMPSAVLSSPNHALAFVDHVLNIGDTNPVDSANESQGSLRFLKREASRQYEQDEELLQTAVEFLLSCLEGRVIIYAMVPYSPVSANPNFIPTVNDPHIANISGALKSLSTHSSRPLRQAAREATLVLIARRSHTSLGSNDKTVNSDIKGSHEIYQEALLHLQDPLLPVRAQGLAMLRRLVDTSKERSVDAALVPAILDIFINSVQDEDSFIFLNAVQGLAVMVQTFGKDVFRRLCDIYITDTRATSAMNKQELDVKLRVGEALTDVIGKCGQSLGGYGE